MTKILGSDSHSIFPLKKTKIPCLLYFCQIDTLYTWEWTIVTTPYTCDNECVKNNVFSYPNIFLFFIFFCILIFKKKNNVNFDSIKFINDFKMSALRTKWVKSKFLNVLFFWKDAENAKTNANTSKIFFLDFCCFFLFLGFVFLETRKGRQTNWVMTNIKTFLTKHQAIKAIVSSLAPPTPLNFCFFCLGRTFVLRLAWH